MFKNVKEAIEKAEMQELKMKSWVKPNRAKAPRASWAGICPGSANSLMCTPSSSCAFHVATL